MSKKTTIWSFENVEFLIKNYPHFGANYVAEQLNLTYNQVKSKVDKLKLNLLPKSKRLCINCKIKFQYKRYLKCHDCFIINRNKYRHNILGIKKRFIIPDDSLKWISRIVLNRRTRINSDSKNIINVEFMYNLWKSQNGICYYSGLKMQMPKQGCQRTMYTASIDRLDNSKGYTKDNVVWCCWFYNHAKNNLSKKEFINLCSLVVYYQQD